MMPTAVRLARNSLRSPRGGTGGGRAPRSPSLMDRPALSSARGRSAASAGCRRRGSRRRCSRAETAGRTRTGCGNSGCRRDAARRRRARRARPGSRRSPRRSSRSREPNRATTGSAIAAQATVTAASAVTTVGSGPPSMSVRFLAIPGHSVFQPVYMRVLSTLLPSSSRTRMAVVLDAGGRARGPRRWRHARRHGRRPRRRRRAGTA